ncbi:kinase-like domain-containing protein [Pholiota molesta]|nr:kinase-like domain-containing protein [Pholiota molesta]
MSAASLPHQSDDAPSADGLDLSTVEGVRAYLAETAFASADIAPLSGGTANYVFRLRLSVPHEGKETLVFKHAKPYVKDYQDLAFDLGRQFYEVEALRRVQAHAIIMEDTGAAAVDLKTFMKTGNPSGDLAAHIGSALGTFLGNPELCDAMKGNDQAKKMTAWAFYGRIASTLTGQHNLPKLQDPPLEVDAKDLEVIKKIEEETTKACLEIEDQFVMGDFWPGNVLVLSDAQGRLERLYVIDWELSKAGLPGVEIGQFCAEMHMLRRCIPDVCKETASLVLDNFFREYRKAQGSGDVDVARQTLVRWGTHMVILGARVDWGGKELSRELVLEGARMLVEGETCTVERLEQSVVAGLL